MQSIGLILEGGGMRGVYTAGVLDLFMDEGLFLYKIYAVSAGACHACSYVSKQRGRAYRTVYDFIHDRRYASFTNLITTGDFFGVKMTYNDIPNVYLPFDYNTFLQSDSSFYAVLTNCATGLAEYVQVKDLHKDINIIRASSSLPLMARMVNIGQSLYLDGGLADSIPLARSISDGNKKNVVIMTQHRGFSKKKDALLPVMKMRYIAYPELVRSIENRHNQYNASLKDAYDGEKNGSVFIIQPDKPVELGRIEKDRNKLQGLYQQGYDAAKKLFPNLKKFLDE